MIIGEVIGNVWATRKDEKLGGLKLMIVQATEVQGLKNEGTIVAADIIGAGIGDRVIVATGGAARVAVGKDAPIDSAIVGIIDSVDICVE